jgi:hypothetical protein
MDLKIYIFQMVKSLKFDLKIYIISYIKNKYFQMKKILQIL